MRNYVTPATELLDLASEDIIRTSLDLGGTPEDGNEEMF